MTCTTGLTPMLSLMIKITVFTSIYKNKGLCPDEWYHYEADGHKVWAEFLINYITENKLI